MIRSSIADHVMGAVLVALALLAFGLLFAGCSVKKIEYEKNDKGEISYRIYENDHWLKTESTGIKGGMTDDGKFVFEAEGMKSSPSEEFNRTMQTYTTAFIQLAQIAAAAYNPSSTGLKVSESESLKVQNAQTLEPSNSQTTTATTNAATATSTANATATSTTNATDCVDCVVPAK